MPLTRPSSSLKKRLARMRERSCRTEDLRASSLLSPRRKPSFMTVVTVEARGDGDMNVPDRLCWLGPNVFARLWGVVGWSVGYRGGMRPSAKGVAGCERLGDRTAEPRINVSAESVLMPLPGGVEGVGPSLQLLPSKDADSGPSEPGVLPYPLNWNVGMAWSSGECGLAECV